MSVPAILSALLLLWLSPRAASGQALEHYDLAGKPAWRAVLPADLAEISGMAFTPEGRLLAHGDEHALIWNFDPRTRRLRGRFGLVGPGGILQGDFEDIAVIGERVFLVTSDAAIYEGKIVPEGSDVSSPSIRERATGTPSSISSFTCPRRPINTAISTMPLSIRCSGRNAWATKKPSRCKCSETASTAACRSSKLLFSPTKG